MLPQPPPNAPAPPPSEAALLSQRKWGWLWTVGVVSIIILALAGLTPPGGARHRKYADQTEAWSNARQIGLTLFEFEKEFGRFPDADTITAVQAKTSTHLDLGKTSSNEFFRQLIASNITQSEAMFYAKINGARKPDNVISKAEALKMGECAFTYILGATELSSPGRPLVVAPMIPGTDRFDPKPFEGKAVILRMDNSVSWLNIDKAGYAIAHGGNLLDPSNPIWDGHPPVIAWPEE